MLSSPRLPQPTLFYSPGPPGVAPPLMGLGHLISIDNQEHVPTGLPLDQSEGVTFSTASPFLQMTLSCVEVTDKSPLWPGLHLQAGTLGAVGATEYMAGTWQYRKSAKGGVVLWWGLRSSEQEGVRAHCHCSLAETTGASIAPLNHRQPCFS